jgi:hypothetical protein
MEVQGFRFGKHAYRPDARTLLLASYADLSVLPTPPATLDNSGKVPTWPMFGNDTLGDCTCAAAGHMVQLWTTLTGNPVTPTQTQVVAMYEAITGGADTGAQEVSVLKYWRKHPLDNHSVAAFVKLDLKNRPYIEVAASLFGGVYIGLALPGALDPRNLAVWDVPASGPVGPWAPTDGHAVNIVGYDAAGLTAITWGRVQRMTWNFWDAYCDEAWALLSKDFLQHPPAGFNAAALQQDLTKVAGAPAPAGTPGA